MNSFNPTTKTQEALQEALQTASSNGNPDIRPAHLLAAILSQEGGIAAPVLKATGVDPDTVLKEARELVDSYPKAEGANMANPQFNRDGLNVLTKSQELAGELAELTETARAGRTAPAAMSGGRKVLVPRTHENGARCSGVSKCTTCISPCTPASVRPATVSGSSSTRSTVHRARSSSSCTVRRPGWRAHPWKSRPS